MPNTPVIYVIGGPNGAGKTTFAREFLPAANVVEFLNADLLAAGLSPLQPSTMAVRSARLLLGRWRELLTLRRRFFPSLRNFFSLYLPLADEALLFNAAGSPPKLIARWQGRTALRIEPIIYDRIQKQIETGR